MWKQQAMRRDRRAGGGSAHERARETRGVERVKFAFEGKDGWTSVTSTGGVAILELAQPPPKSAG